MCLWLLLAAVGVAGHGRGGHRVCRGVAVRLAGPLLCPEPENEAHKRPARSRKARSAAVLIIEFNVSPGSHLRCGTDFAGHPGKVKALPNPDIID
jgi:hypothetical protein